MVRRGSDMVRRGSVMVRRGSVMVRLGSVMVRRGSDMVRRGSVGWCGVAQLVVRRLAGPSSILGPALQVGFSPLSTSAMRKWREASPNGDG